MRTRSLRLGAIGASIGLVLMASAITPAVAAPQPTAFTATNCSSFQGATTTGSSLTFSGVGLRTGDKITATVSPALATDKILVVGNAGAFYIIGADGPASGFTYTAPVDGYYTLQYSLVTTGTPASTLTWSFSATCSSTSVAPSPSPSPTATTKPGKGKRR
jgi:hypothetical protein